jgi:type 1 glutamine amidotransferase
MSIKKSFKTKFVTCIISLFLLLGFHLKAQDSKTRILIITERIDHFTDPYNRAAELAHMYEDGARVLKKCLEQTTGVEVMLSSRWPGNSVTGKEMKNDLDAIVLYGDAAPTTLLVENTPEVMELINNGVGIVAIHWSTGAPIGYWVRLGRVDDGWKDQIIPWLNILGGLGGIGFNETTTSTIEKMDPSHPIHRGVEPFELREEYFVNPTILSFAEPLFDAKLQLDGQEKRSIVAWAYQRMNGKKNTNGRSFGTVLGHFYADWAIEDFRRLVVNGILWSAHLEIPVNGAPVKISQKDLEVPDYWNQD